MKYANETEMVEGFLIDIENDIIDWEFEGEMSFHQLDKIKLEVEQIKSLLRRRYPLKAKKKVKEIESFIYNCRKHYSYNYFDELQRDSYYAY